MLARPLLLAAIVLVFLLCRILLLQLAQIVLEAIEALLPEPSVVVEPIRCVLERRWREPARPPLRFAAALDQTGALQNFQMLGNGRHAHRERLGQLRHRGLARGQAGKNRAPGWIGE